MNNNKFGKMVKLMRKKRGITAEELSLKIFEKRNPSYIYSLEAGGKNPGLNTMHKIAEALEFDIFYIALEKTPDLFSNPIIK